MFTLKQNIKFDTISQFRGPPCPKYPPHLQQLTKLDWKTGFELPSLHYTILYYTILNEDLENLEEGGGNGRKHKEEQIHNQPRIQSGQF